MIDISTVFELIGDAAAGGLDVLISLTTGVQGLFFSSASETGVQLTLIGTLALAGVGAPLAWKFIKYIISLFNKVKPN